MTHTVHCAKFDKELDGLEKPPFPGELGQKIYDNISQQAWDMWFSLQTMMINEYRLDMHDPDSRKMITEQMKRYFFGKDEKTD